VYVRICKLQKPTFNSQKNIEKTIVESQTFDYFMKRNALKVYDGDTSPKSLEGSTRGWKSKWWLKETAGGTN